MTLACQIQAQQTQDRVCIQRSYYHNRPKIVHKTPKIILQAQTQRVSKDVSSQNTQSSSCLAYPYVSGTVHPNSLLWCMVDIFGPKISPNWITHTFFQKRPNSIFEMKPCDPASLIESPPEPSLILEGL